MKGRFNSFIGLVIITMGLAALTIWVMTTLPYDNFFRLPATAVPGLASVFFLAAAAGNLIGALRGSRIDPVWQNRFFAGAIIFGMGSAAFFVFCVINGFQMRIHGELPWQFLVTVIGMIIGFISMLGMVFVRGTDIDRPHFRHLFLIWSSDWQEKADDWKKGPPN